MNLWSKRCERHEEVTHKIQWQNTMTKYKFLEIPNHPGDQRN